MTPIYIVITALATIVSVTQPAGRIARLGDVATTLPDSDVAEILRLASCGPAAPWLMTAFPAQIADIQVAEVYCAADHVNDALRRGQLSWIQREKFSSGLWSRWALQQQHHYAQLVPFGRSFEQITGEQDHNRPFRLYGGDFTDEELISLVKFLRSGPKWTAGNAREQVETKWPVTLVRREAGSTVVVSLSKDRWEGQRVTVRRSADGWTIVGVNYWIV